MFSHEDNLAAGMSAEEAADLYIKTATQTEQVTFVHAPGIQDYGFPKWTKEERRLFRTYVKGRSSDYIPFTLNGTTFSGDPHTTLGNTLRSILYICYYLRKLSKKPWCDDRFFITAAGDDVCVFSDDTRLTD